MAASNEPRADSEGNQNDPLDEYIESLGEKAQGKACSDEICYNDHENEAHLEEFYGILSRKKAGEDEARKAAEAKKTQPAVAKTVAPTVSADEISTRQHVKDIYEADPEVEAMSLEECVAFKKRFNIETFGTRVPKPISSFTQLAKCVPRGMLARIERMGFFEPTPVQCQAIPCLLQGRNTIIMAETGSGKTIAYALPVVVQILSLIRQWKAVAKKRAVYAVVLTLTRELCHQVDAVVRRLCKNINLRIVMAASGVDKTEQFKAFLAGCELAICTPARLVDLVGMKGVNLGECKYFVADEADKMFTPEYHKQTQGVLSLLRDDTLLAFVSASSTDDILRKIKALVRNAITVKVGQAQIINLDNIQLKFMTMFATNFLVQKRTWLAENMPSLEQASQVIVFCNTREAVEQTYAFLSTAAKTCCMIHGDMQPAERHEVINCFKKGMFRTLVATDLVCRGVDVPAVGCVVNYDPPKHLHTFLHRVGRCGRANARGTSYTLLTRADNRLAAFIVNHLETAAKKTAARPEISDTLRRFAMTYGPYKNATRMGIDFVEFVSKGTLTKKGEKRKRPADDRISAFLAGKQRTFSSEPVAARPYGAEPAGGREYTATDDISSSEGD